MKIKELLKPSEDRIEEMLKAETRLQILKDYLKREKYIDRETLLILIGEQPESAEK